MVIAILVPEFALKGKAIYQFFCFPATFVNQEYTWGGTKEEGSSFKNSFGLDMDDA